MHHRAAQERGRGDEGLADHEVLDLMWSTGQELYDLLIWWRDHAPSPAQHDAWGREADVIAGDMEVAATGDRTAQWQAYERFATVLAASLAQAEAHDAS